MVIIKRGNLINKIRPKYWAGFCECGCDFACPEEELDWVKMDNHSGQETIIYFIKCPDCGINVSNIIELDEEDYFEMIRGVGK